jgi:hypothetical protein
MTARCEQGAQVPSSAFRARVWDLGKPRASVACSRRSPLNVSFNSIGNYGFHKPYAPCSTAVWRRRIPDVQTSGGPIDSPLMSRTRRSGGIGRAILTKEELRRCPNLNLSPVAHLRAKNVVGPSTLNQLCAPQNWSTGYADNAFTTGLRFALTPT